MRRGTFVRTTLPVVAAVGVVGNGLRLRRRLAAFPVIEPARGGRDAGGASDAGRAGRADLPEVVVLHVDGGAVDDAIAAAAAAHLAVRGLDAVDLVPADLPVEELLDLLRLGDARLLRSKPLLPARGAGRAVVVRRELAERAGLAAGGHDPVEMRRAFTQAKRYSPHGCDQALAPALRAVPLSGDRLLSVWREEHGRLLLATLPPRLGPSLAAGLAAAIGGVGGAAVVAGAAAVQPAIATAGTAARPADRLSGRTLARVVSVPARLARAVAPGGWRPERPAHTDPAFIAAHRRRYARDLERGVERFLGDVQNACPVCGSPDIRPRVSAPDMVQGKPGTFRIDACGACGTHFQNPRLTGEGIEFYYRDFYDGAGAVDSEMVFGADDSLYAARARFVGEHAVPKRWLDVGGGHGHFCLAASTIHPGVRFELLDQARPVAEAVRRGWVADGHAGPFPELAAALEGAFDVVTMFHYLEHTVDPLAELDAAARVLEPGGTLVVEVPAPDSRWADLLGWAWGPWLQPQHLHLLPLDTMVDQLEQRGFDVVATDRAGVASPFDLEWAAFQVVTRLAPGPNAPWTPPRGRLHRAARALAFAVASPVLAAAVVADRAIVAPLVRVDDRLSSAYTVVARRRDHTANPRPA